MCRPTSLGKKETERKTRAEIEATKGQKTETRMFESRMRRRLR